MKKIFSFLAVVLLTLGFTACEDVPAPYGINDEIVGDGAKTLPFVQSFENSLGGYKNFTLTGEGRWINDHKAAVASGYNNATQVTTAGSYILVSPEITLEGKENAHIVMEYTLRYLKTQDDQKVMITKAFDEANPAQGWEQIPATLEEVGDWDQTRMLDINVPESYMGAKVRIALYYNTPSTKGSSWQIKNLSVLEGVAEGGEDKPEEGVKELPYAEPFATEMGAFKNYTTSGVGAWQVDSRGFAKASGFTAPDQPANQGTYYMVSPEISLAGKTEAHLSYEYINSFNDNPLNHQFMINVAFDESKPAEGWVALKADHEKTTSWTDWKKADIQIPAEYMGKNIRVAFRYECSTERASTFEVKNFNAAEGKAEGGEVKPEEGVLFSAALTAGLDGMTNYLGTAEWTWVHDANYGCAKVSGHVGGKGGHKVPGVAYFVTPEISLENVKEAHLAYTYAIGYMSVPEYHQVMINTNFNEATPDAGWVALNAEHQFVEMKFAWFDNDIQIPAEYMGKKIRIGFRYECDAEKASTWELKNLSVAAGKANEGGNEGDNEGGNTPDAGDINALNGDFECWVGGQPNNWASVAGNGHLSQSTDAHSGKYSVKIEGYKSNKRLAYKVIELQPGTYNIKYYVKAATEKGGATKAGYAIVTDGVIADTMHDYVYSDFFNDLTMNEWKEINHTITIEKAGTYSMLVMNCKNPGGDILVDDYTLTDANGNAIIK